ncbi:MAG: V-type ATP synthase subunit F [Clostridia bacterium]|nr:V-type ATP synthase subunit F [Clostridia bacterium]
MYKIGVIGPRDRILGFISLGFGVFEAENTAMAGELIDKLAWDNYAIIFITEAYARELGDRMAKYKASPLPSIVVLPDKTGGELGNELLRDACIKAVGADILFK